MKKTIFAALGCLLLTSSAFGQSLSPSAVVSAGSAAIGKVGTGYTAAQTPITVSSIGTTGSANAILPGVAGKTTYICGWTVDSDATAASAGAMNVQGTIVATLNYRMTTAANSAGTATKAQIYTPCIPASAVNTQIAVVTAAPGAGGNVAISAWGYQE